MTSSIIREIIRWIVDHLDNTEPLKIMLRHVYLPIKLTEEQLEDLIKRVKIAKGNEQVLKEISDEMASLSEENLRQMFV